MVIGTVPSFETIEQMRPGWAAIINFASQTEMKIMRRRKLNRGISWQPEAK